MRKSAWIAFALVMVILFLGVAPWVTGIYLQRHYASLLTRVNNANVTLAVPYYHRHWFSSDATLIVKLTNSELLNQMRYAGLRVDDVPTELMFTQHIVHGPLLYQLVSGQLFGLARIDNQLIVTPSIKQFMKKINLSLSTRLITMHRDVIGLTGHINSYIKFNSFQFDYPNTNIHIGSNQTEAHFWIDPIKNRVVGDMTLDQLNVNDTSSEILVPNMTLHFDLSHHATPLWLGEINLSISAIQWTERDGLFFSIKGVDFSGTSAEKNGLLSGTRSFRIEKVDLPHQSLGPFELAASIDKININGLAALIDAYRDIMRRGELYKSQLQRKMYALFPGLINPETRFVLDKFAIDTPNGQLAMNGELHWSMDQSSMPDDAMDLVQSADANLDLRISKRLSDDMIYWAAQLPFFNAVGPELNELYWELRQELYFAERQNAFTLAGYVDNRYLSESAALELLQLQKRSVSYEQYALHVKKLLLDKEITREVSYALNFQYLQIASPLQKLKGLTNNNQAAVMRDMHAQLDEWLKLGYIKKEGNDYIVTILQKRGDYQINGHGMPN